MPVGAAIAGAGIVSAGAGYLASKDAAKTQSQASLQAAQLQLQAAREAAALQLGMFNTIRDDLSGYRGIGQAATPGYMALLGLPAPSSAPTASNAPLTMANLTGSSTTPMPKVGDANWGALLTARPDVLAQYQAESTRDAKSKAYLEKLGINDAQGYAQWWAGQNNIQAPQWTQADIDAAYPQQAANQNAAPTGSTAPALDSSGIQTYLENLPGYKFMRDQGIKSVTNALTTKGLGGISGPMAKGIARFVTGLADSTYGEQIARVQGAVNTGANAAAQTGNFGSQAAQGASGALVGGANAQAAGITGAANANAAGTIGAANAIGGGVNNLANAYLTSRVLGMYGA